MKRLKPKQYYIDLYDRDTVVECSRYEKAIADLKPPKEITSKHTPEVITSQKNKILHLYTYCVCGLRYENKEKTIQTWMERDKKLDDLLENTEPPNIYCEKCSSPMNVFWKDLYGFNYERVLFFFKCEKCQKNRAYFDNGQKFDPVFECAKCSSRVFHKRTRRKNKITSKYTCSNCGHVEKDVLDLDEKPKKKEEKKEVDEKYETDRRYFCFSEERGKEYMDFKMRMKSFAGYAKEKKEREKMKDLYEAVETLKRLNIVDAETLLNKALEKQGFIRLKLESPILSRDVKVEFTVQDTKSDSNEYERERKLKKTISKALQETNWKLIDDGIYCKLGIFTGRLRGLENEEDLVKLVKSRIKKKNS